MDDIIQWIALGVIFLIIIVLIIRKIIRFRRRLREGNGYVCNCDGCDSHCQFADKITEKKWKIEP